MAPTTALAVTPEALDNILQYLEKRDVWAVALTCKALLPACLRSIWQTLEVTCESSIRRPGSERETVVCEVDDGPSDIMDDLLRAIPHLQRSVNEGSKIAGATEIIEQCLTLFFGSLSDEYKSAAEARYRLRAINPYGTWGAVGFSAEFAVDTPLAPQRGTNPEPPLEFREWCRAALQGCVEESLNHATGIHTKMLEESQVGFNGTQFFSIYTTRLRTLAKESLDNSQSAACFVFDEVERFQKKFKTFKRRIADVIAERLVAGEKIGIVEALSIWIEAMVAHDRELYRIGYFVE
ncbi:hypothetical protein TWF102_004119 [Orbilia oligospora]|uniref:F-box domain-containing protein n=1 Tax=Orbilia oligospora TaxID=2813651 RepID=A0A7C8NPB0_ORBOL|nr:hypothetical protein TWF102_004119 [Orbilia oligospora]KAF3117649.1 hypothetical protein TWF103_004331 [Orbilia oligospora]KAF3142835.1 hypothetical protein TWF703_000339 [Orbilia oligospora]KAF3152060.1 hypothetical protein TWF594_005814 [Orbilia oligospora]